MKSVTLTENQRDSLGVTPAAFPGLWVATTGSLNDARSAGTLKFYDHSRGGFNKAAIKRAHVEKIADFPREEYFGIISVAKLSDGTFVVNDGHHRLSAFELGIAQGTIQENCPVLVQVVSHINRLAAYTTINAQDGLGVSQQLKNVDLIYGHLIKEIAEYAGVPVKWAFNKCTHLAQIIESYREDMDLRSVKFAAVLALRHDIKSNANIPWKQARLKVTKAQQREIGMALAAFYAVYDQSIRKRKDIVDDGTRALFAKSAFFGLFMYEFLAGKRGTWAQWETKLLSRQLIKSASEISGYARLLTCGRHGEIEEQVCDINTVVRKGLRK